MHLAVHIFSASSRRVLGLTTHRVKHLSVIFCTCGSRGGWRQSPASRAGDWRAITYLHHILNVLRRELALDLHLGIVNVPVLRRYSALALADERRDAPARGRVRRREDRGARGGRATIPP